MNIFKLELSGNEYICGFLFTSSLCYQYTFNNPNINQQIFNLNTPHVHPSPFPPPSSLPREKSIIVLVSESLILPSGKFNSISRKPQIFMSPFLSLFLPHCHPACLLSACLTFIYRQITLPAYLTLTSC